MKTYMKLLQLAQRKGYSLEATQYRVSLWTLRQRRWPGWEYYLKQADGSQLNDGPSSTSLKDVRTWLLAQPDA